MITPVAISTIGYQYYIVYTVIGFCIPVSVYFLYPEVSTQTDLAVDVVPIHRLTRRSGPRPWDFALRTSISSSVRARR